MTLHCLINPGIDHPYSYNCSEIGQKLTLKTLIEYMKDDSGNDLDNHVLEVSNMFQHLPHQHHSPTCQKLLMAHVSQLSTDRHIPLLIQTHLWFTSLASAQCKLLSVLVVEAH